MLTDSIVLHKFRVMIPPLYATGIGAEFPVSLNARLRHSISALQARILRLLACQLIPHAIRFDGAYRQTERCGNLSIADSLCAHCGDILFLLFRHNNSNFAVVKLSNYSPRIIS